MRRSALWTLALALVASALAAPSGPARAADVIRVGEGPFITGGGFFIARAKGYFDKLGVKVETKTFNDGSLAVPSMISGELDVTFMTGAASLFNSIAKGAPLVIFLDRGNNKPGRGYTVINVTEQLADHGLKTLADFAKLKGKKIGIGAVGSINQYDTSKALIMAGLDPRKDVHWITNVPQPDLMKMLGQQRVDATNLAYQFGFFAQNNKWGPIVANGDQIVPNGQVGMYAVRKDFLTAHREALVRFAEAYLQGAKEFNAAAAHPDQHPDIVEILAKNTFLNKPAVVKAIAPNWSYENEDGIPNVSSVMDMQNFWADYYHLVDKKIPEKDLFDLSIAKDAKARLDRDHPFGS
jgi:NitT/TauT family transport system substrate-binding protein